MLLEVPLEQAQHHILPPRDKTSEFEKSWVLPRIYWPALQCYSVNI